MVKRKKDEEKIADQFEWKKCVYAKSVSGGGLLKGYTRWN